MPVLVTVGVVTVAGVAFLVIKYDRQVQTDRVAITQRLDFLEVELNSVLCYGSLHIPKQSLFEILCLLDALEGIDAYTSDVREHLNDLRVAVSSDKVSKPILQWANGIVTAISESDFVSQLPFFQAHHIAGVLKNSKRSGYTNLIEVEI